MEPLYVLMVRDPQGRIRFRQRFVVDGKVVDDFWGIAEELGWAVRNLAGIAEVQVLAAHPGRSLEDPIRPVWVPAANLLLR